ncbi:hypothetical protein AJ80_06727 [Polytolypa hystricis UAMH7299]|uniref:Zn(2)-C6 fungal-type domain-containing protein n=1 Tax=Polytolypa hystricis (strain UAMH7299) TaxID=1447883 RepID=A0A2B7XTV9_POLH7|nr:hypothetical protein AJ80_06727 [Polytolypa hystricis UAMH7299]
MSGFYVGPFGRILPVPDDNHATMEDGQYRPKSPPSRLSHYRLPPPQKPTTLQFGTDTSLSWRDTSSDRRDSVTTQTPWKDGDQNAQKKDQLPPVSQLLTPGSHSSVPGSPFASLLRGTAPLHGNGHQQPQPRPSHEGYDQSTRPVAQTGGVYAEGQLVPHTPAGWNTFSQQPRPVGRNSFSKPTPTTLPHYHNSQPPHISELFKPAASAGADSSSSFSGTATLQPGSPNSRAQGRLAHVVDECFIEGEGLCYIYSDGSHCPKQIDGEVVNASWGVTKAGKPRKRLALACLTCRDKKIKCTPNIPKCDQCQKSGRECRFENAPRASQPSPKSSQQSLALSSHSAEADSKLSASYKQSPPRVVNGSIQIPSANTPDVSPQPGPSLGSQTIDDIETWISNASRPLKRRRVLEDSLNPSSDSYSQVPYRAAYSAELSYTNGLLKNQPLDATDPMSQAWAQDPFEADPKPILHYLEMYFIYVNGATYCMFPREPFTQWVKFFRNKSLDDKMLLYAVLAVGALFSGKGQQKTEAARLAKIAKHAVDKSQHRLNLQLAQSRMILSVYHFMIGASVEAWDLAGSAIRAVCGLGLNVESEIPASASTNQAQEQALQNEAVMECRRRTFWIAFLLDRQSTFLLDSPTSLRAQDVFLRLPCREDLYELQKCANTPYFQTFLTLDTILPNERESLDPMAFLVEISAIWGDVLEHNYRAKYIPASRYTALFEEFYTMTTRRIDQWLESLPDHFTYSTKNMEQNVRAGKTDIFIAVHILYHATMVKLNRHARHNELSDHNVNRNVRATHHHALEVLRIALSLSHLLNDNDTKAPAEPQQEQQLQSLQTYHPTFSTPLTGYAILSATDVICAAGAIADLPEYLRLINGGLDILTELAPYWHSAREQLKIIEPRIETLLDALRRHAVSHKSKTQSHDKLGYVLEGPTLEATMMENLMPADETGSIPREMRAAMAQGGAAVQRGDLAYSLPRDRYFHALGLDHISVEKGNVIWVRCGE